MQSFNIGDQIYDSYGRKCNSRFFVNYGFALENNPDNECLLKITLPTDVRRNTFNVEYTDFQVPKILMTRKRVRCFPCFDGQYCRNKTRTNFFLHTTTSRSQRNLNMSHQFRSRTSLQCFD
eukprot:UN12691